MKNDCTVLQVAITFTLNRCKKGRKRKAKILRRFLFAALKKGAGAWFMFFPLLRTSLDFFRGLFYRRSVEEKVFHGLRAEARMKRQHHEHQINSFACVSRRYLEPTRNSRKL